MPDKNNKSVSVHTSRTIMFTELEKVMNYSIEGDNYLEALNQNVTGKLSNSGAVNTAQYLKKLYGFKMDYPPFVALKYFWKDVEPQCRPLLTFVYAVNPEFIRKINFKGKPNLKNIEDYRLEELIYKDLKAYPNSGFSDIHGRIGLEINQYKIKRLLKYMVKNDVLDTIGERKWTKYFIKQ